MDTAQKNKKLIEAFCTKVFIQHDLSNMEEFIHDDYVQHNADCPQGRDGFLNFFKTIFAAVPDFSYSVHRMVAEGDYVWTFCRTTGTHTGTPWLGVQPSGRRLDFDVVDMFRLKDGRIAEHWDVADTYTFFRQLGRFQA